MRHESRSNKKSVPIVPALLGSMLLQEVEQNIPTWREAVCVSCLRANLGENL